MFEGTNIKEKHHVQLPYGSVPCSSASIFAFVFIWPEARVPTNKKLYTQVLTSQQIKLDHSLRLNLKRLFFDTTTSKLVLLARSTLYSTVETYLYQGFLFSFLFFRIPYPPLFTVVWRTVYIPSPKSQLKQRRKREKAYLQSTNRQTDK